MISNTVVIRRINEWLLVEYYTMHPTFTCMPMYPTLYYIHCHDLHDDLKNT